MHYHTVQKVRLKARNYNKLAPIFKDILYIFMDKTGMLEQSPEAFDNILDVNMIDLERGQKPEGLNRPGALHRIIFPIRLKGSFIEFYLCYSKGSVSSYRRSSQYDIAVGIKNVLDGAGIENIIEEPRPSSDYFGKSENKTRDSTGDGFKLEDL